MIQVLGVSVKRQGFITNGLGLRDWGLGFGLRVKSQGFTILDLGFSIHDLVTRV